MSWSVRVVSWGLDDAGRLVGDGGADGGAVGFGAVQGLDLERAVDACLQGCGGLGEQGGAWGNSSSRGPQQAARRR